MIRSEIVWRESVELRIDLDPGDGDHTPPPSATHENPPTGLPQDRTEERKEIKMVDEIVCIGSDLEKNHCPAPSLPRESQRNNSKKECPHSQHTRDLTDCSSLHSNPDNELWQQQNPFDATKYFGFNARQEFFGRHKWISEHKNIFQHEVDEMKERIRFDRQKQQQQQQADIEFPFAPHRPVMESEAQESVLPSSSISGLFSDLSFVSSIPPTMDSVSTFDASQVMNDPGCPTSPRTKFLSACVKNKVNPPASLILRKKLSRSLQLQHYGFGDHYGVAYALALGEMPLIDTINIEDNNLTDKGLFPIIRAIISLSTVTDLNLSNNIVDGDTAKALSDYLSSTSCCIKRLILQKADIDDDEGTAFISALKHNSTLTELDISHNLLGKSENMNTVFPDLITGGEALADLLSSNSCALTTLRLPWNMIRLDGAVALSSSLQHNSHILYLDISYNSIGEAGGEALGSALLTNHTLQTLLIQNNNLTSSACFAICVGIEENFALREVNLDGNPIGELGAQVLTQLPIVCGERVKVSAARCNLSMKYPKDSLFNMESPSALYTLQLSDHFERAICLKLLRLVAAHPTFEFNEVVYQPPTRVSKSRPSTAPTTRQAMGSINRQKKMLPPSPQVIQLKQGISDISDSLDDVKKILVQKLQQMKQAANNSDEVVRLFHSFDSDRSGSLDQNELQQLLYSIGLDIPSDVLENAIEKFDVDGIGALELPEFMDFLKSQEEEATARIQEITELPVMIDATTWKRYIPPFEGIIRMSVGDTYTNKKSQKIISALDHQYVMDLVSRGTESVAKVLIYSIQNSRIRLREALSIFHAINQEVYDKAEIAMKILPCIADPADARQFLLQAFRYDKTLWKRLDTVMGTAALKVCIGLFNGFYSLDLSRQYDRVCLAKLLQQSQSKRMDRMSKSLFGKGMTGDVSQWGDWSSFRNAYIDDIPTIIVPEMFNPMPTKGKVHFDFSGGSKYHYGESITNDSRCVNLLLNLQLIPKEQNVNAHQKLKNLREVTKRDLAGDGQFEPFIDRLKAEAIQLSMLKFYHELPSRPLQHDQGYKHAVGALSLQSPISNTMGNSSMSRTDEIEFVQKMTSENRYEGAVIQALGPVGISMQKRNHAATTFVGVSERDRMETTREERSPLVAISEDATKLTTSQTTSYDKASEDKSFPRRSEDLLTEILPLNQRDTPKKSNPLLAQRKSSPKNVDGSLSSSAPRPKSNLTNRIGFFQESFEENPSSRAGALGNLGSAPLVTQRRPLATPAPSANVPKDGVNNQESQSGTWNPQSRSISRSQSIISFDSPPILKKLGKTQSASNLQLLASVPRAGMIVPTPQFQPSQMKKMESLSSFDEEPVVSRGPSTASTRNGDSNANPKVLLPQNTEEYMQGYGQGVASLSSQASKAIKVLDALCDVLSRVWILSRHLALICEYFQDGLALRTLHFGTYRVELIINLYSRLADVNNFDVVLRVLSPFEIACVYCRLGILNLFNPLKPEGCITLNLARREERVIAKILAVLSVYEPGENWLEKSFRWGYDKEEIPGWELTKLWLTEEGMLQKGFLVVNYYSGEGKSLRGCNPNVSFRKSLLHLVSLEESDFIHDLNNKLSLVRESAQIHSAIEGDKVAKSHTDLWMQLLSPPDSSSCLIAQGMSVTKVFQQLKINPGYRDPVRDIFAPAKRKTIRRTVRGRPTTRSATPKSRGSAKP